MNKNAEMIEILPATAQPAYRHCGHDSLQYHFFAEDRVFAARLFLTPSLDHTSVWMYDGQVTELLNTAEPIKQSKDDYPNVQVDQFSLVAREPGGVVRATGAGHSLEIDFDVRDAYAWREPMGTVVHQPNLSCRIRYDGDELVGVGYCKRYCWDQVPSHWGYRFFHGTAGEYSDFVWTADATFGTKKYAYFKVLTRGGILLAAAIPDSCHRDDAAYATIEGVRYTLSVEELGHWQTRLSSDVMDSQMTQRYCRMRLSDGHEAIEGYAINELCFGTLG